MFKREYQVSDGMNVEHNIPIAGSKPLRRKQRKMQSTRYRDDGKINLLNVNILLVTNKLM